MVGLLTGALVPARSPVAPAGATPGRVVTPGLDRALGYLDTAGASVAEVRDRPRSRHDTARIPDVANGAPVLPERRLGVEDTAGASTATVLLPRVGEHGRSVDEPIERPLSDVVLLGSRTAAPHLPGHPSDPYDRTGFESDPGPRDRAEPRSRSTTDRRQSRPAGKAPVRAAAHGRYDRPSVGPPCSDEALFPLNVLVRQVPKLWATRSCGPVLLLAVGVVLGVWAGNHRLPGRRVRQAELLGAEGRLRERAVRLAERSAIAAEMHDVLGHRLSLIALHTGALSAGKEALPPPLAARLALLRTASTEALIDLRDVLGVLRSPISSDDAPAVEAATTSGASTLRNVAEIVEQARAAGQRVEAVFDGQAEQVPAAHRLAVLRLVQEALTNARKHAPDSPVKVRVRHGPPATLVEVTNALGAHPARTVPSGYGLVGLAERVEALDGHLHAGPVGAGDWRVAARIPHPSPVRNGSRA
ncbi:sensor histidine kinase [Streptomyces sp. NPDC057908]|uniref:sensor histidine kinase n=1 Tax=Streptomyces sp. NPDC057908 TaxID=3346276 RepID=UPI0036E3F72C